MGRIAHFPKLAAPINCTGANTSTNPIPPSLNFQEPKPLAIRFNPPWAKTQSLEPSPSYSLPRRRTTLIIAVFYTDGANGRLRPGCPPGLPPRVPRRPKRLLLFLGGHLTTFLIACFLAAAATDLLPIAHDTTPMAIVLSFTFSVYLLSSFCGYFSAVVAVLQRAALRRNPNAVAKAITVFLVAAQSVFFLVSVVANAAAIAAVFRRSERKAIFIAAAVLACLAACAFWFYKEM